MTTLPKNKKEELEDFLQTPAALDYSDRDIAKRFDISHPTVSVHRKKNTIPLDIDYIKKTVNNCVEEITTVKDHWKSQQLELYQIKNTKKKIIVRDEEGNSKLSEIELEPMEKLQLLKQIGELDKYIAFVGSQEQLKDVIKWVNRRITQIEKSEAKQGTITTTVSNHS